MAKPRSFVEKKTEPGMGVPKSLDRNLRLELQNIIENIKTLQKKIEALENDDAAIRSQLTDATNSINNDTTPNGGIELYDSTNIPAEPPLPYLRFERDIDGDVQIIYIGTET